MSDSASELLALLEQSGHRVHRLLYKLTSKADVAEELMQELFLRMLRSQAFRNAANQEAYLMRSAIHLAFDWRKSCQKDSAFTSRDVDVPQAVAAPIDLLIESETIHRVLTLLDQLSEQDRELICLRFLQEESYEAIAGHLEISVHHARSRCSKAIARLRKKLALVKNQDSKGSLK